MTLRTAVVGVGHLGRHHARIHAALASEAKSEFVSVCDINEQTAREIASERGARWTTDWRTLIGVVDAVSLATPTESHAEIACALLEAGIHVLVEKPISRTLEEADRMMEAARRGGATLMVGHLERFNPALIALRPHVRNPVYFEIHRVGQFTARSLDIDVVLWLVGHEVEVKDVRAVGLPVLTNRVDAANARIEFATGAVANITASRVGTKKIRKMRFFQPHDYIAVDYATKYASISSLAPPSAAGSWPGVQVKHLDIVDVEPLRTEIELFLEAARERKPAPVTGLEGRQALALAERLLARIHEHPIIAGMKMQF